MHRSGGHTVTQLRQSVPEDDDLSEAAQNARANLDDLYLWVLYGGRERKVSEYTALVQSSGLLKLTGVMVSGFGVCCALLSYLDRQNRGYAMNMCIDDQLMQKEIHDQ